MTYDHDGDDLSPDPAVLARLHALVDELGLVNASRLAPISVAEQHRLATGHRLSFGCCRARPSMAAGDVSGSCGD